MQSLVHNSSRSKRQLVTPALGSFWHSTEGGGIHLSIPLSLTGPTQPRTMSSKQDWRSAQRRTGVCLRGLAQLRTVKLKSTEPGHEGGDSEAAGLLAHCHLHTAQKRPPEQPRCVQAR